MPYQLNVFTGTLDRVNSSGTSDSLTNADGGQLVLLDTSSPFGEGVVLLPSGGGLDSNFYAPNAFSLFANTGTDGLGSYSPVVSGAASGQIILSTTSDTTAGNNTILLNALDGIYLSNGGSYAALLKVDLLTSGHTYQLPDGDGTFALTTDISKAAIGLGNVDDTSDATKNSATASLTNKDLTSDTNAFPTFNQNTTGSAATLAIARTIDGQSFNGSTNITVIAPGTHAATSKTTPVDADELSLVDSAASNVLKKLTWASLKATAKTYFDTLYQAVLVSGTNIKTINGSSLLGSGDLTVSGSSSKPRIQNVYNFETIARYSISNSGTSASTTFDSNGAYMAKGTTSTGGTSLSINGMPGNTFAPFDKNPVYSLVGQAEVASASNTWDFTSVFGGFGTASAGFTNSSKHFGFILRNNDGTQQVVCTNADGTTQKTTVLTQSISANTNAYTAVMTSGSKIEFYCDGTLLATHTVNLPSGGPSTSSAMTNVHKATAGTNNNAIFLVNITMSYDAY